MTRYITAPQDAECRGWTDDGWSIEPLYDAQTGLYARLTYAGALEACELLGAVLPTRDDVIELHRVGLVLSPVMLPTKDMMTIGAARLHDGRVREQLAVVGWTAAQRRRLANLGKVWIEGAPLGSAHLMGWYIADQRRGADRVEVAGRWIQSGTTPPGVPGFHDDGYCDYSSMTICRLLVPPAPITLENAGS